MAFDATLLRELIPTGIVSPGNLWMYGPTTQSSTDCSAVGFFTACGLNSRTYSGGPIRISDPVMIVCATGSSVGTTVDRVQWLVAVKSTADQASTTASTGFRTNFNVTLSGS